jgi:transcriptional regulator of arginine metabolism
MRAIRIDDERRCQGTLVKKRTDRQSAIRTVIRSESIRTQRALAERLQGMGFECTQATISRDIGEMGLLKTSDGTYVLPEDLRMKRMVHDMVVDVRCANNLVVIHATSGTAQGVAAALDAAELSDILGSVAGDDTILVIAADDAVAQEFARMITQLMGGGGGRGQ